MTNNYCGADCANCPFQENCRGCRATCGSPFGGRCVAAETIKADGMDAYQAFKTRLTEEVNALLAANGLPGTAYLTELLGSYVNLAYPLPSGDQVKFLDGKNVYLGAQIEDAGRCVGVIADEHFILVCRYGEGGRDPELLLYKKREDR